MTDRLSPLLAQRPWLLADGAMGSNLFERGLVSGDAPEFWNVDHPDRIASLHRSFAERGSRSTALRKLATAASNSPDSVKIFARASQRTGKSGASATRLRANSAATRTFFGPKSCTHSISKCCHVTQEAG